MPEVVDLCSDSDDESPSTSFAAMSRWTSATSDAVDQTSSPRRSQGQEIDDEAVAKALQDEYDRESGFSQQPQKEEGKGLASGVAGRSVQGSGQDSDDDFPVFQLRSASGLTGDNAPISQGKEEARRKVERAVGNAGLVVVDDAEEEDDDDDDIFAAPATRGVPSSPGRRQTYMAAHAVMSSEVLKPVSPSDCAGIGTTYRIDDSAGMAEAGNDKLTSSAGAKKFEGTVGQLKKELLRRGVSQADVAECIERRDLEELWRAQASDSAMPLGFNGHGTSGGLQGSGGAKRKRSPSTERVAKAAVPIHPGRVMDEQAGCRALPPHALPSTSAATASRVQACLEHGVPCGKMYADLRHLFVRALWRRAKKLRFAADQKHALDATVRALIVVALHRRPLRSVDAALHLHGIGTELATCLRDTLGSKAKDLEGVDLGAVEIGSGQHQDKKVTSPPPAGTFASAAEAALVALLEFTEEKELGGSGSSSAAVCSLEELLTRTHAKLEPGCAGGLNESAGYYLRPEHIDVGWMQIKKLCVGVEVAGLSQLVKERSNKAQCESGKVFELLSAGRAVATRLRSDNRSPAPPGPLRELSSPDGLMASSLAHVLMAIDFREGGGSRKALHPLCQLLDREGMPYLVRHLNIADYIFLTRTRRGLAREFVAPVLIERKSVEDVACSISDGRWLAQQRRMMAARQIGGDYAGCRLVYIIEGDAKQRRVHGGGVGRANLHVSLEQVEHEIASLAGKGFEVVTTTCLRDTCRKLGQILCDVAGRQAAVSGLPGQGWQSLMRYDDFVLAVNHGLDHGQRGAGAMSPGPVAAGQGRGQLERTADDESSDDEVCDLTRGSHTGSVRGRGVDRANSGSSKDLDNLPFIGTTTAANGRKRRKGHGSGDEGGGGAEDPLMNQPLGTLKDLCRSRDEAVSGTKKDMCHRLSWTPKPMLLIERALRKQYVPKANSANSALLVALLLHHQPGTPGLSKEELMAHADALGISKDPMGGTGGFYDGWSGVKALLTGDPPLMQGPKKRYSLTTQPPGQSGVDVAKALHILTHRHERMDNGMTCRCRYGSNAAPGAALE